MTAKFRPFLVAPILSVEANNIMSDMFPTWIEKLYDSSLKKIVCCKNENHGLPMIMEEVKMLGETLAS